MCFSDEYLGRTLAEDRPLLERIVAAYHNAVASSSHDVRQSMVERSLDTQRRLFAKLRVSLDVARTDQGQCDESSNQMDS
jgi:hypothetical protein